MYKVGDYTSGEIITKMQESTQVCALCHAELMRHPIIEGVHAFCCAGCHAVFNILFAKNQLDHFEQHPIFLQALRSGLISNPALLDQIHKQKIDICEKEREKLYIEIGEMWCPSCAEVIRLMLLREKGVINCVVDYATDLASIEYSPRYISKEDVLAVINKLGYIPIPLDTMARKAVSFDLYLRFAVAAFCSLNIMMFAYPLYATYFNYDGEGYGSLFAWLSLAMSLPVVTYSAWPIWRRFANSMMTGISGMETLVALGVGAAFSVSVFDMLQGGSRIYFDSMSVIIAFVLLGKIIEAKAKFSAKDSLMRLTRSSPRRGRRRQMDGALQFVLIKEIAVGDILVAYPGERIALDGVVVDGKGACDESLMTGEAIPIVKKEGEGVMSGTILVQGHLTYKVTGSQEESALHKIIEMVERDIGQKSVYVRAADRIVRWFVPTVIAIALAAGVVYWFFPATNDPQPGATALMRALSVLLISCPCAIGIAAPAAESYLLNRLASIGVIVRNRGCLPHLGCESIMIFDKTGTVTEGRYSVQQGLEGLDEDDHRVLRSLAMQSTHPVAYAISAALEGVESVARIADLEEVVGQGMRGTVEGIHYILGSARLLKQMGVSVPMVDIEKVNKGILSMVYFAKGGKCLSQIFLGDTIRPEVPAVIESLKGQVETLLLSGDSESTVSTVAIACGFHHWRSGCSPLEKRAFIETLKNEGKIVCMLGDGINDAPAITAAHVGISVVSATDMSIQVSDLLLTTDKLTVIPKMRSLAEKGLKIVHQNLFWAFFYNIVGIALAFFGVLSPIFAAFAMSISSLTVLFNARRI
ncbi:MAG: heavy metal translocating P-type ATPase [Parachlamydiaceae bacterium]